MFLRSNHDRVLVVTLSALISPKEVHRAPPGILLAFRLWLISELPGMFSAEFIQIMLKRIEP